MQLQLLKLKSLANQMLDLVSDIEQGKIGTPIEALLLSTRAQNCLHHKGIIYIEQLMQLEIYDLHIIRNLGKHCLKEICNKLKAHGLKDMELSQRIQFHKPVVLKR